MKKITHIPFPQVFGIAAVKRLAFQDGGKTEAMALKGLEASTELDTKEGQKSLDKSLKSGEAAINKQAEEYKKKYEGKEDADKAKGAIEEARKKAVDSLKARYETAKTELASNATKASNEAADTLVKDRKEKAKSKFSDSHLENVSVGDSSIDTKLPDEKEFENEDMSDGAFKEAMVSMLRTVYIAEGEEAANKLSEKMKSMKKIGFTEMKNDPDFKLAQGVEHNPPLIQFDPDVTSGSYNSRVLAGKIYGLNHAADSLIKDETAREEYKKYIADEGRKVGQAKDAAGIDAILTPAEWAKQHGAAEKMETVDPEKLQKERLAKVNDHLANMPNSRGWEYDQLKGVLLGRLQSEPDPAKWDNIMNELGAKACGVSVDDYKNTSWENLEKQGRITGINEFVKTQADAMGKYALDEGKNHDGKTRGYIAGLMSAAEEKFKNNPSMLKRYKEQLKTMTDSEDFQKKLGQNLDDSDYYSKRQRDMVWNNTAATTQNLAELKKLGAANSAIFEVAKTELPTPDKFEAGLKEKEEKKAESSPREAYVDGLLENIPAEKGKERDTLRGILMAAIGPKENKDGSMKTPEEMAKLIKPILDTMGFSKDQGYETVNMEKLNKILEGRNDFGDHGKKMDHTSKGYYAALIYQAEQQFKDNPKGLEAYKKHLKDELNSESFKGKTEDQIEKLKKYQGYLEDADTLKLTLEQQRLYREKIAALTDELFMVTRKATKWPEDFGKDFEKTKKEDLAKGNKEFLDKYGTSDKLDAPNAKKGLDGIFGSVPKEKITDANKKAVEDKKKELATKLGKATTQEARLKVLAEAQDYTTRIVDDKASETRYQDAMETYTVTTKILDVSKDKKKYDKYVKDMAKALKIDENDPAVKKVLRDAEDAKDEDRAAIIAQGVLDLNKKANNATPFNKEDFDTYSAYITEKKEAAAQKKTKQPSGGGAPVGGGNSGGGGPAAPGGGGAPKAGPQGGPKAAPPGAPKEKDKPAEKEKIDSAALIAQLKSAVASVIAAYKGKERTKEPAQIVQDMMGAFLGAIVSTTNKYDLDNNKGATFTDENGISVTVQGKDKIDTNVGSVIDVAWVEKNMKAKEKINDPTVAATRMTSALQGVIGKYDKMDYKAMEAAGITDYMKLNQAVVADAQGAFAGQNIDPTTVFASGPVRGYVFRSDGGKQWLDARGENWTKTTFETKKRNAEIGDDMPKLQAIRNYMTKQGYSYLSQNVGNGTITTMAQFNSAVNSTFAAAASNQSLKDGSYDVWVGQAKFNVNYKDGKYAGVNGDYAGLAGSVRGDHPDAPKLA